MRLRRPAAAALLLAATVCTACSPGPDSLGAGAGESTSTDSTAGTATGGHGQVDGAAELAEPKVSLVTLSSGGSVTLTGLADLEAADLGSVPGAQDLASDSRLVAARAQDGTVRLLDSGVWTVDHGDHQHYYEAPARDLGTLATEEPLRLQEGDTVSLSSSESLTAVRVGTTAVLLDRAELARGTVSTLATTQVDEASWTAPLGQGWVVVSGSQVRILDSVGHPVPDTPTARCHDPRGGATTRAGVVVVCQDGAVVVAADETAAGGSRGSAEGSSASTSTPATAPATSEDASATTWSLERVDLPEGTPADARPAALSGRPGRPVLAAVDPTGGFWLLHVRDQAWTHVETPGVALVAVSAMDDSDSRVVGVDTEGRVRVWADPEGAGHVEESVSEPAASPALAAGGVPVTQNRVYVPGADSSSVLEVDAADGARVARTIPAPGLLSVQEVGL